MTIPGASEFLDPPKGVTRGLMRSPRVSWKFVHEFYGDVELEPNSTSTAYIVLWEGEGRDRKWLDDNWDQIWNTRENDDLWEDGFGDGFILQEALVQWEGPPPGTTEMERLAGKALRAPIEFRRTGWSDVTTEEHVDVGVWNIGEGLFVEVCEEACLVSVVSMMRDANDSLSVDISAVDIEGEGDRCVEVVVPASQFQEEYERAVPPRVEAPESKSSPDESFRFY